MEFERGLKSTDMRVLKELEPNHLYEKQLNASFEEWDDLRDLKDSDFSYDGGVGFLIPVEL